MKSASQAFNRTGHASSRRRWAALLTAAALLVPMMVPAPALADSRTAFAFGDNEFGQLGTGKVGDESATPRAVRLPARSTFSEVEAGLHHSLALAGRGQVYAWGDNEFGQLGTGTVGGETATPEQVDLPRRVTVRELAAGDGFTLAQTGRGEVYAWGDDDASQLGDGRAGGATATPQRVRLPRRVTIEELDAGGRHALALTDDGTVYAWGSDREGQLGDGRAGRVSTTPQLVDLPDDVTATAVAGGYQHTLVLTDDGTVYAFGRDAEGQLGDGRAGRGSATPRLVDLPDDVTVTAIAAGGVHSLALTDDGDVYAWGSDRYGQLGDGRSGRGTATPQLVRMPRNVEFEEIVAGARHNLALTDRGDTYAWGDDGSGQLGDGRPGRGSATPQRVRMPRDTEFTELAAGGDHSLVLADVQARRGPDRGPGPGPDGPGRGSGRGPGGPDRIAR